MTFVLPGNARSLRFTGEAKALAVPKPNDGATTGGVGLGKPRIRKPPPPVPHAGRINTPTPSGVREGPQHNAYGPSAIATPYLNPMASPVLRHPPPQYLDSNGFSDSNENPTMAMDREALDVLPGGLSAMPKPAYAVGASAIPNFRPPPPMGMGGGAPNLGAMPGTGIAAAQEPTRGAPLIVWLFAGILAAIVSYLVAPELLLSSPTHAQTQVSPASAQP